MPSTRLKMPQPASTSPMCVRQGGAISPRCHACTVSTVAAPTKAQVARWKNPSASVFVSRPASVVIGCPVVDVSMWCHCRIWCRPMPSRKPPSPSPSRRPGARGARSRRDDVLSVVAAMQRRLPGPAWAPRPPPRPVRTCTPTGATRTAANVQDAGMAGGVEVVGERRGVRGGEALAAGLLAFTVIVWGCTGRVTAEATPSADPVILTALRAAPTAIVLLLALPLLRYRLPATRSEWAWTSVSGLLMVTWFLFAFTESVRRIGPGIAIVLMSTSPFFIAIAERYLFGRRITRLMLLGMIVGFAGVILVASAQIDASGDAGDMAIGMGLAISAAIAWAAGTMIVKAQIDRKPDTDLVGLTTGQYVVGGAVLLVLALLVDGTGGAEWSSGTLWLAVAFISIVGSALATIT